MPNRLVTAGIKLLELLFAAGIIGAAVVVLLTAIEDVGTMFGGNHEQKADEQKKEASV